MVIEYECEEISNKFFLQIQSWKCVFGKEIYFKQVQSI